MIDTYIGSPLLGWTQEEIEQIKFLIKQQIAIQSLKCSEPAREEKKCVHDAKLGDWNRILVEVAGTIGQQDTGI